METKKIGFGFRISKKPESKVSKVNTFKGEVEEDVEKTEYVSFINDKVIESNRPIETKKELVIPLIVNNNWRNLKRKTDTKIKNKDANEIVIGEQKEKTEEEKLEELAKKELLREAQSENETREKRKDIYSTRVIPLLVQNQVPEGYETDERLDVTLRAEEPSASDYEKVPVEDFGLAMLRGMGWKPGEGVGKNSKVVKPIEVKIRPKGIGLGAEIPKSKQTSKNIPKNEEQEELVLKLNAFVRIEFGEYTGIYGQVESLDDELTRAVIRPAISGSSFAVPTAALRIVSKSEYQKEGKVINKSKYDEYKVKSEKRIYNQRKERSYY